MLKRSRYYVLTSLTMLMAVTQAIANDAVAPAAENNEITKEEMLKASEGLGYFIGRNMNNPALKFDVESVIKGLRDGFEGKPAKMTDKEYEELMLTIQKKAYAKKSEENLKAADEFLAKNAKEPGVIEIEPKKLQYIILQEGKGAVVEAKGHPSINFTGKYIDGTLFGSSEEVGGPISISLENTIPGFSKGIQGMKEGEKRRLFIHPDLGYGTMGQLQPNSLLIFDIEVDKAISPKKEEADADELDDDEILPLSAEID